MGDLYRPSFGSQPPTGGPAEILDYLEDTSRVHAGRCYREGLAALESADPDAPLVAQTQFLLGEGFRALARAGNIPPREQLRRRLRGYSLEPAARSC